MPTPIINSQTKSLVNVAIATFFGALFAFVTSHGVPQTLNEWHAMLAPALGAGIAAELIYLRTQIAAFLTAQGAPAPAPAPSPAAAAARVAPLAVLALLVLGCSSCQAGVPVPAVVPSVNLAVCIFDQYATAPSCRPGGNAIDCVAGIAAACGADAAAVEQVLASHQRALVADGYVPRAADAGAAK